MARPARLAALAVFLLQCALVAAGGALHGLGPFFLALTLPPGLLTPLVAAILAGTRARRRTIARLAVGGLLAVPAGLIAGYAAGAAVLATLPH